MKKKITDLLKKHRIASVITALTLVLVVGSVCSLQQVGQVPELPVYMDPEMETTIEEEETPLASKPKVQTKTSRATSTKKVKMKKASGKTYTKKLPATSRTSTSTSNTSNAKITKKTTKVKNVTEKYRKRSNIKLVTTVTTTKVTTTTVAKAAASASTQKSAGDISSLAPKEDSRVLNAFKTLGFSVQIDPSVSYSGYFNSRNRQITVKRADDTIYHELGHFVAFIAGNVDKSGNFMAVYNQEKSLYTAFNKAYVTQNSQEYFAESAKEFILNGPSLKKSRPKTYTAVKAAFDKITDQRVVTVKKMYSSIWK